MRFFGRDTSFWRVAALCCVLIAAPVAAWIVLPGSLARLALLGLIALPIAFFLLDRPEIVVASAQVKTDLVDACRPDLFHRARVRNITIGVEPEIQRLGALVPEERHVGQKTIQNEEWFSAGEPDAPNAEKPDELQKLARVGHLASIDHRMALLPRLRFVIAEEAVTGAAAVDEITGPTSTQADGTPG